MLWHGHWNVHLEKLRAISPHPRLCLMLLFFASNFFVVGLRYVVCLHLYLKKHCCGTGAKECELLLRRPQQFLVLRIPDGFHAGSFGECRKIRQELTEAHVWTLGAQLV